MGGLPWQLKHKMHYNRSFLISLFRIIEMSVVSAIKAVTAIAERHLIIHREQLTYYFFLSSLTWTEKRESIGGNYNLSFQ